MESIETTAKNNQNRKIKALIAAAIVVIIIAIIMCFVTKDDDNEEQFETIEEIAKLTTLKCYYHNVAEYKKEPDGVFKYGLFQYGYKKFWIEYDGEIEISIDFDKVNVDNPNRKGVVRVYVPEPEVGDPDYDETKISDPIFETGAFTDITTKEKIKACSEAQKTMKKNAMEDKELLKKAKNNAKEIIEDYIVNIGKQQKKKYTVKWVDKPF